MNSQIPEADWRRFRDVHKSLLQRFCQNVLDEAVAAAQASAGSPHDRYLRVYRLIQKRDKEIGRIFNDFRRSTALLQLLNMRRSGLLTDEDLSVFSPPTQEYVNQVAALLDGEPEVPEQEDPEAE